MKDKLNWIGIFDVISFTLMTSVVLLSLKGDIICKMNYPVTPLGDCIYGRWVLYSFVMFLLYFFLKDIKLSKESK